MDSKTFDLIGIGLPDAIISHRVTSIDARLKAGQFGGVPKSKL
jgi:hypothetical protein